MKTKPKLFTKMFGFLKKRGKEKKPVPEQIFKSQCRYHGSSGSLKPTVKLVLVHSTMSGTKINKAA